MFAINILSLMKKDRTTEIFRWQTLCEVVRKGPIQSSTMQIHNLPKQLLETFSATSNLIFFTFQNKKKKKKKTFGKTLHVN